MDHNTPHKLTESEWREIANFPVVREAWGLDNDVDPLEWAALQYGVRFDFTSGGPGYFGDLYITQGDALNDSGPMVLRREKGELVVCSPEEYRTNH